MQHVAADLIPIVVIGPMSHHLHKNGRRHVWDWDLSPFLSRKSPFKGLTVYWPLKEEERKRSANHPMSIFTDGHKSINIKSSFPDKHVH